MKKTSRLALSLFSAAAIAGPVHAAPADPACSYAEAATLPIRYTGESLSPTIEGEIDHKPATMLVDTGSTDTFLTMTAALKRHLDLRQSNMQAYGVGGLTKMYEVRLGQFAVGPAHTGRTYMQVIGNATFTPSYEVIVGAPFLMQLDLEISLAEKKLRFLKGTGCDSAFLAYWNPDAIDIPIHLNPDDTRPHFTVEVNGKKMDAIIDTGAAYSVIERGAAARAGIVIGSGSVTELAGISGVGTKKVRHWRALADTLAIGDETIRHAEIGIRDTGGQVDVDVILGADFLRSHRVLFAMGQKRLYFSYVGGALAATGANMIEPWVRKEADEGNPDAQYVMAQRYASGDGVPKDPALAASWMARAAAQGQPRASLMAGVDLMLAGRYGEAATRMRGALDQMPGERFGPFWLYMARVRNGDAAAAMRELEATFDAQDDAGWPAPIADFYRGRIDAAALLAQAGKQARARPASVCEANYYLAEWQATHGGKAGAPQAAPNPAACQSGND